MTSTFPVVTISTDRLVLRPLEEADEPALTEMMRDELVTAWTAAPVPYGESDAREFVRRRAPAMRTEGEGAAFAVVEFLTQRLVGLLQLRRTDWRVLATEVAYVIAPWARGEGYASESVLALAQWLFHDQKFERLELRTPADNTAAQQVAQKLGCISEGVLRNAWIARTRTEDWGSPQAEPGAGWAEIRTDLLVWSLLPEDLDGIPEQLADAGGYAPYPDWLRSPR